MREKFFAVSFNRSRDITILRILGKTQLQHPLTSYTRKVTSMPALNVSILHIKFYQIPCNVSRDIILTRIIIIIIIKTVQQHLLQRYIHLICIFVTSNHIYPAFKFLSDFIKQNPKSVLSPENRIYYEYSALQQGMSVKFISMPSVEIGILLVYLVRFYAIEYKIQDYQKNFGKNVMAAPLTELYVL